jgi:hypothetical protein
MIVPKQDFVAASGVKSTFGFGRGYKDYPALVTPFIFTNESVERSVLQPVTNLLEAYISSTETVVGQGRYFE